MDSFLNFKYDKFHVTVTLKLNRTNKLYFILYGTGKYISDKWNCISVRSEFEDLLVRAFTFKMNANCNKKLSPLGYYCYCGGMIRNLAF